MQRCEYCDRTVWPYEVKRHPWKSGWGPFCVECAGKLGCRECRILSGVRSGGESESRDRTTATRSDHASLLHVRYRGRRRKIDEG